MSKRKQQWQRREKKICSEIKNFKDKETMKRRYKIKEIPIPKKEKRID
jgi:hypothetical protein